MKTETGGKLLRALQELWEKYPHWRFGQLVCNVAGWTDVDAWDVADDQLLAAIRAQQDFQRSQNQTETPAKVWS